MKNENDFNDQIKNIINRLETLTKSDAHLCDRGMTATFIAMDLEKLGENMIDSFYYEQKRDLASTTRGF
jgi:hypothetical protein